jgi:hypothetical protein
MGLVQHIQKYAYCKNFLFKKNHIYNVYYMVKSFKIIFKSSTKILKSVLDIAVQWSIFDISLLHILLFFFTLINLENVFHKSGSSKKSKELHHAKNELK